MRFDKYILDDDGNPVPCDDLMIWAHWFEEASRAGTRIVKQDFAENEIAAKSHSLRSVGVSTVFLGLDHRFSDHGPPILWESLVSGTSLDGEMRRYTSRADALRGHEELLQQVREAYEAERAARSSDPC